MTDKNYMKRRFKCRCYQKDNTVKIYDGSEILFDVSYRDFDDAFYLGRKLQSVIMELNTLHEENEQLKSALKELREIGDYQADRIQELNDENEQLKQQLKQSVFVNLDGEDGCWNCEHCYGGFCDILENPIVSWIKGVSKCNLKKWELKE